MLEKGSLTKRLILASEGQFRVHLIKNQFELPRQDERRLLNLPMRQVALVREVDLICHNEIWVTARSIIPLATLTGAERQLGALGERPLGGFLFASKTMRRLPFEVGRQLNTRNLTAETAQDETSQKDIPQWARRSVFTLHNKPLLVSEYFEPALFRSISGICA